ncbi:MAG: RodZ domain-containing protein [Candidatus Omnitrophota bacterium]
MKSIGKQYQALREKNGLTIDDICKKTKIYHSVIESIEDDTIQDKFDTIYVKSFLKNYAEVLAMDYEMILKEYQKNAPAKDPAHILVVEPQKYSFNYKYIIPTIAIIAAIILLITLVIYFSHRNKLASENKDLNHEPARENITHKNKAAAGVIPVNEELRLLISAVEDVWLQLSSDDTVVFQGVLKKDMQETWTANKHFRLWTGKAEGLTLALNGNNLGTPGRGVKKNIIIDRHGLK